MPKRERRRLCLTSIGGANVAERFNKEGRTAKAYTLDITDRQAVLACFDEIEKEFGPVYALVNNAGAVDQRPFRDYPEQIDRMFGLTLTGHYGASKGRPEYESKPEDGLSIFPQSPGRPVLLNGALFSGAHYCPHPCLALNWHLQY